MGCGTSVPPQKVVPTVVQPRVPKSAIGLSETSAQKLRSSAQAQPRPKFGEDCGLGGKTKATVAIAHTQPRALPTPTRAPRPKHPKLGDDLVARYQSAAWTASLSSNTASIPPQGQPCDMNFGRETQVRTGGRGPAAQPQISARRSLPALNYGPAAQPQAVSAQSRGQPSRVASSSRQQSLPKADGGLQHGHGRNSRDDSDRSLKMHVGSLLGGPVPRD